MIATILVVGGFLILCGQFIYEVFQTHFLIRGFDIYRTKDQALATYIFGGILLMVGLLLLT